MEMERTVSRVLGTRSNHLRVTYQVVIPNVILQQTSRIRIGQVAVKWKFYVQYSGASESSGCVKFIEKNKIFKLFLTASFCKIHPTQFTLVQLLFS